MQVEEEPLDNLEIDNEDQTPQFDSITADHKIIQLFNNFIPRVLIPLENLFDHNDVPKNPLSDSPDKNIEIYNIGSFEEIKNVNIFASLSMEAKEKYLSLLKA